MPWSAPYTLHNSVWAKSGAAVPICMIQPLDELSAGAKWNNVNTYGSGKVTVVLEEKPTFARKKRTEADRVIVQTLIPYRLKRSSRGYSHYERLR